MPVRLDTCDNFRSIRRAAAMPEFSNATEIGHEALLIRAHTFPSHRFVQKRPHNIGTATTKAREYSKFAIIMVDGILQFCDTASPGRIEVGLGLLGGEGWPGQRLTSKGPLWGSTPPFSTVLLK